MYNTASYHDTYIAFHISHVSTNHYSTVFIIIIIIIWISLFFVFCLCVFRFFLFTRGHFVIGLWAVKFTSNLRGF
jgi:hypothetical protein